MRTATSGVSLWLTPTSMRAPAPISPTTSPSTRTDARRTRWMTSRTQGLAEGAAEAGDGVAVEETAAVVVMGAEFSPARGGPSAPTVNRAAAFQIIQPAAPLSRKAFISAWISVAVYARKDP